MPISYDKLWKLLIDKKPLRQCPVQDSAEAERRETGVGNGSHFGWPGGHHSGIRLLMQKRV